MLEKSAPARPDVSVLAALFDSTYDRLVRYLAVRLGNLAEAEDLASETFARAVEAFDQFQWRGIPLEAWLFRIAHNLLIDHHRKGSKRQYAPLDSDLVADQPQMDEGLHREEEGKELHRALGRLTEAQRQVLALRFGAGMTSEQAGKVMGKRAGAVREMQSSAIKTLRGVLGADSKPSEATRG